MQKSALVMLVTVGTVLAASCEAAAAVSPGQVPAHAGQYDGKAMSVGGTVRDFRARVSRRGNAYETFELCGSAACVHVFAWGDAQRADGEYSALSGTFWKVKQVGTYTFHDELDVDGSG